MDVMEPTNDNDFLTSAFVCAFLYHLPNKLRNFPIENLFLESVKAQKPKWKPNEDSFSSTVNFIYKVTNEESFNKIISIPATPPTPNSSTMRCEK